MSQNRSRKRFLDCSGMTMEEAEQWGTELATMQRDIMWYVADLARYAEAKWPDTHHQVWPEWISHGMLARAAAVGRAYPKEADRQAEATFTIYMQNTNRPDRIKRVQAHVDAGRTSDEARKADQQERAAGKRWLLAVDVNYFIHRFWFSGAGVEAAVGVSSWVQRTVARLKDKGLTDVACCFDSKTNHRKALTSEWEDKYKDRPPKEPELVQQIQLVRELLEGHGFACVSHEGMEADDCMASFAAQFDGRVTLLSQDKDVRQSLSSKCNILLDVEWTEDETTGDMTPDYKWYTSAPTQTLTALRGLNGAALRGDYSRLVRIAKGLHVPLRENVFATLNAIVSHLWTAIQEQPRNLEDETGLTPAQFLEAQILMGDSVDNVKGAPGIGVKGATDLIKEFGSADAVIKAAKAGDERIKEKKREALIEFESKADITRQLVTLRTTLPLPQNTRV
jgi:5'-3' exonuclease